MQHNCNFDVNTGLGSVIVCSLKMLQSNYQVRGQLVGPYRGDTWQLCLGFTTDTVMVAI